MTFSRSTRTQLCARRIQGPCALGTYSFWTKEDPPAWVKLTYVCMMIPCIFLKQTPKKRKNEIVCSCYVSGNRARTTMPSRWTWRFGPSNNWYENASQMQPSNAWQTGLWGHQTLRPITNSNWRSTRLQTQDTWHNRKNFLQTLTMVWKTLTLKEREFQRWSGPSLHFLELKFFVEIVNQKRFSWILQSFFVFLCVLSVLCCAVVQTHPRRWKCTRSNRRARMTCKDRSLAIGSGHALCTMGMNWWGSTPCVATI